MRVGLACTITLVSLACMCAVTFGLQPKAGNLGLRQVYNYATQGAADPNDLEQGKSSIPPAYDMCTDAAGNLYFAADVYKTGPSGPSHRFGKLSPLSGTQFLDLNLPAASTYSTVSTVFTDIISAASSYPAGRSKDLFSPTGLACSQAGSLLTVDYQYDVNAAAGNPAVKPAFVILSGTGTTLANSQMNTVQETEGKVLRDPYYTDFLTGLVWDETNNEVLYVSNCVYYPGGAGAPLPPWQGTIRNCGDPASATNTDEAGVQTGSWIGRYLQPGVNAVIRPRGAGTVDLITAQDKNPNNNYDNALAVGPPTTSVLPSGAIKDASGSPIGSNGYQVTFAYRSFFAYDRQRRQAYFGGRWNNVGEAGVPKVAGDLSTNPETQNGIWSQSQTVLPNQQNTITPKLLWRQPSTANGADFPAFDPTSPNYVTAQKFQALALSPSGDLYFCNRDLKDNAAGTLPTIYYFTASQLRALEAEASFTGTTFPNVLQYSDKRRTASSTLEPSLPSSCENLSFDPSGNLYLNDGSNIFVISNLETKTILGEFFSLPVVVEVFGQVTPPRV